MKKCFSRISAVNITLLVAIVSFTGLSISAQGQPSASKTNSWLAEILANAPPPPTGFATPLDYVKSFTREKDILDAYHAGKLSKGEAMLASELLKNKLKNKASMDTYGKVVDQNGQPVIGAKVTGIVDLGGGDNESHKTKTDNQGLFHFSGLHGQGLGIELEKDGYFFDEKLPSADRPDNYLPDPSNPLIITMWKLKGAEPMKHVNIDSSLPCDGGSERFDLLTDRMNRTDPYRLSKGGDLIIKLTRDPLILNSHDRYKPFNWSITIGITNGGLIEATNIYPYEAPIGAYQSAITLNFPTNMVGWKNELNRAYFFKAQNGRLYGRMILYIDASRPQPPTYFQAEIYANPGGSRNLEFDADKEIP